MSRIEEKEKKVVVDEEYVKNLKKKAVFLDELLSFVEDKYLGYLMEKTEEEESVSLSEAKKVF